MQKKITLLGGTGTIGKNTVSIVKDNPEKYSIETIIANKNVEELSKIAIEVGAKNVVIADESKYEKLKGLLGDSGIKLFAGDVEVNNLASEKTDLFVSGAVGFCALKPTMAAIKAGSKIGLANKECLVCAGDLMMGAAKRNAAQIIPIDSEHNSIYQVFDFDRVDQIEKITLTASGGPFRSFTNEQMRNVTPEMAVKHPNWDMGKKISVDSATMMNKGLEVIEAYYLFPIEKNQIDILVHPESIIHGLVSYKDGSTLAGLSSPDMKVPIAYALAHPERVSTTAGRINLTEVGSLTFEKPDLEKFKCLKIALNALDVGQNCAIALNASNEVSVASFLDGKISFQHIAEITERTIEEIEKNTSNKVSDFEEIFDIDLSARRFAESQIEILNNNRAAG